MIPTAESALLRLWPPSHNSPEPLIMSGVHEYSCTPDHVYRRAAEHGGNTCFANSVIQSVFYTPGLWKIMRHCKHLTHTKINVHVYSIRALS